MNAFKRIAIAALALGLAAPEAVAAQPTYPLEAIRYSPKAPKHLLRPYRGQLTEYPLATRSEVRKACRDVAGLHSDFGCSIWNGDRSACTIIYLFDKPHVYWHEIAHCNGGNFHD